MVLERMDITKSEDALQLVLHRNRYDFVLARLLPGQDVLEIGTGLGNLTRELLPKCGSYAGVEYDPAACAEARRRTGAEILEADARELPFADNRFSFIVCLEVLEHLGDYQSGVRHIHRCLRPDGVAIVSVPYRRSGGPSRANPYHVYEPGEDELVSLFHRLFANVETHYQFFEETPWMTLARRLHIRRLVGLDGIYADLSAGLPHAVSRLRIGPERQGLVEGLMVVASGKKPGA